MLYFEVEAYLVALLEGVECVLVDERPARRVGVPRQGTVPAKRVPLDVQRRGEAGGAAVGFARY